MVHKLFQRLIGLPCWHVAWDPQTNLSLNFGRPRLVVREPISSRGRSPKVRQLLAHRRVSVRGDWWLWIWCAYWKVSTRGLAPVTGASPRRAIRAALALLDGQRLTGVVVNAANGRTEFCFDLGARLDVRRFDARCDGDMWTLYEPNSRALAVRGDGHFTHEKASRPARYRPLK